MNAYATEAELAAWLGDVAPDGATRLLSRASSVIDRFATASFSIDTNGIPVDSTVKSVLRDACCAQVEFWLEVGEEHDIDGISGQMSSSGVSYALPHRLALRARDIMAANGMLNTIYAGA